VSVLGPSFAGFVKSSRTLSKYIKPLASWYANVSGYRQMGLKYDDLLVEENPEVQRALKRLTPREQYDRAYRFKLASQASVQHKPLPKEQWTSPTEDHRYLKPHVEEVIKEEQERQIWDTMTVERK